jgi:alpha-mannosidase
MNALALIFLLAAAQPDPARQPALYVVGYAHLDTQWRWEYPQTISEFLPKTMHDNFALFEKYPRYVFNFSGANRYRMMKEYFPADYERLRSYVRAGRWFPAGSSMEESDVNSPSAESILRQILYGNQFFRRELGRASAEYMLPDCFGFPASLPSILAHAGIRGFSTQKLTWGSSAPVGGDDSPERTPRGTPFNVGVWEGPDGRSVIAALNPGDYSGDVRYDVTQPPPAASRRAVDWPKRVQRNGEVSGVFADYHYYGTGDTGGAPSEASVALVDQLAAKSDGKSNAALRVISSTAEQMFLDIGTNTARLPRYKGELELTNHSAGSLTSQAAQKKWNHDNELLADAAEKASVAAAWLGARVYPQQRLNDAWTLVMGGQFHDIAAGTATPKAYQYSWNDDAIAANQFTFVRDDAARAVAAALDTRAKGTPIVVYNPLPTAREDLVETRIDLPPGKVRVTAPDGSSVPAQREGEKLLFLARVPSSGFAVYDVERRASARRDSASVPSPRRAEARRSTTTTSSLQNHRYRITLNSSGDIRSIFDKHLHREILRAPIRLAFQGEHPRDWPAWNMDWEDQKQPPRRFVGGPAAIRIVERGPARTSVEVSRQGEGSRFVETISLAAGDAGNRIEIANRIDWKTPAAALKATFPLKASNPLARYNWEVGTIERPNNHETQFEVASHDWIDLTDRGGAHGVTILTGPKYGSDKPDDSTLRLTLLYTPGLGSGNGRSYSDQTSQDWGHHEFTYGLASHAGSRPAAWQALRMSQPLVAFTAGKHAGPLGKSFSLLQVSDPHVRVLALKKAEESEETIVRVVETSGKSAENVRLRFAAPLIAAREVDGQERTPGQTTGQPIGSANVRDGALVTTLDAYALRTFALTLAPPKTPLAAPRWEAVALPATLDVATRDGAPSSPGFDDEGRSLPAELLPSEIAFGAIRFRVDGKAVVPSGQRIALPAGAFNRIWILAAATTSSWSGGLQPAENGAETAAESTAPIRRPEGRRSTGGDGDQQTAFRVAGGNIPATIQPWTGFIGQWDTRSWRTRLEELPPRPDAPANAPPRSRHVTEFDGLTPGFVKPAPIGWFASHRHTAAGANEPYAYSYLFAYPLDVPGGAAALRLPQNDRIRILAITVSEERE